MAFTGVRRALVSDVDEIGRINALAWRARLPGILPAEVLDGLRPEEFAAEWARSLIHPPSSRHQVLVAVDGDDVVGYAAVAPSADPDADDVTGEVIALEVDPGQWRRGHGSRLVAAVVDTARTSGMTRLSTWCPLDDQVRRAFWVSAGWGPDTALRDLEVPAVTPDSDGLLREARLITAIADADD